MNYLIVCVTRLYGQGVRTPLDKRRIGDGESARGVAEHTNSSVTLFT